MKKFVLRSAIFVLALLVSIVLMMILLPYNDDLLCYAQLDKDEYLANQDRQPTIVVLGGSSCTFGYHCDMIESEVGMPVYNAGVEAGLGGKFILDNCARNLKEGDILILGTEYSAFFEDGAYGGRPLADLVMTHYKQYHQLLNPKQWWKVLNNIPMHVCSRIIYAIAPNRDRGDSYACSHINAHGDYVYHYGKPNKGFDLSISSKNDVETLNRDFLNDYYSTLKSLRGRGVKVLLCPPPVAESYYEYIVDDIKCMEQEFLASDFPYVCTPESMAYADTLFYDTVFHMNEGGSKKHSEDIAKIILAYL